MKTMIRLAAISMTLISSPSRADFYTRDQVKQMCDGGTESSLRGTAAEIIRVSQNQRCEAYVLGVVDGILTRRFQDSKQLPCFPMGFSGKNLVNRLVPELLKPTDDPYDSSTIIARVLRNEYGCH